MDRELLIEIGCEEIPAGWLPGLTDQMRRHLEARLKTLRLVADAPVETFSTPRRLTARVDGLADRQSDREELVTGPPVSAAFTPDGQPTPAAIGFAKKNQVDVGALVKHETPKGTYLAHRLHERGKAAVDVLADVMTGLLRDLTFPKQMRWDAYLEDGKGDLVFARPIRWLVLLYGGRVVPFVIRRTDIAQGPRVQDVRTGANTYGHRFLTTSGRAGRAIKIKTFEDYRARLLENFVILDRSEREDRIRRELDGHARRLGGRVSQQVAGHSSLLQEVPDLVEYPSVVAGHFAPDFLELPEEVLTTTMIHHQHYFPVVDEAGKLKPAFLAVTNMQAEKPEIIARNSERVLTARLRDAQFFWEADRKASLESRIERLSTILFHKKLGSYRDKAERIAALARWIAGTAFDRNDAAAHAEQAARLCKADLATDMVRELTELQGTMGGIYAREEGLPEDVWKAIYFQYLPLGIETNAPPSRAQLGTAAVTWAAVSLADKIDTVIGLYAGGERPTGSRDPFGLRRAALGAVRILVDLPELTGINREITFGELFEEARKPFLRMQGEPGVELSPGSFWQERLRYLFEQRGFPGSHIRAVMPERIGPRPGISPTELDSPLRLRRKLEALAQMTGSISLVAVAELLKRVKNITSGVDAGIDDSQQALFTESSELVLAKAIREAQPVVRGADEASDYPKAFATIAALRAAVATFFDDVLVMTDDLPLRRARLALLATLRDLIVEIADISEIVPES